jgi:hypothetical protein
MIKGITTIRHVAGRGMAMYQPRWRERCALGRYGPSHPTRTTAEPSLVRDWRVLAGTSSKIEHPELPEDKLVATQFMVD